MSNLSLKLSETKSRIEELKKVETDEAKSELLKLEASLPDLQKQARFEELRDKNEADMTREEVDEFVKMSEEAMFGGKTEEKNEEKEEKEEKNIEDTGEKKPRKYAGIYNSIEDLAKGVLNSEKERIRIENDHPELIGELEGFYKDSQRKVTKLVSEKKAVKPIHERRLHEVTKDEWEAWAKNDSFSANAWLSSATRLAEAQNESSRKVFAKHPEFYAMMNGMAPKSAEWEVFDRIANERTELSMMPNGAEICLQEMEKELGLNKPKPPKPVKKEEKPDFSAGRAVAKPAGGKMSVEDFERMTPEEQRAYMEKSVHF